MKSRNMPIWLGLFASDELHRLVYGTEKAYGQTEFSENDEVYLALLPEEFRIPEKSFGNIVLAKSEDEFAIWTKIANDAFAGGKPDLHPIYHFPLCETGLMRCYLMYFGDEPVSIAAVMDNDGVASLEFVATIPEMRGRGFAKAICQKALGDTFLSGAKIVTVRAIDAAAAKLYRSVGFKIYNYAI